MVEEEEFEDCEFRVSGRGYQSAILFTFIACGPPMLMLMFSLGTRMNILTALFYLALFSPISIIALIGLVLVLRKKMIVINDYSIQYHVGSKMKWGVPLKRIEKVRLYMGGGRTKFPILKIEGSKGKRMISGEKVSYQMIRSAFKELRKRLKKMGLAVMISDEIGRSK